MAANFIQGKPILCVIVAILSLGTCVMLLVASAKITNQVKFLHSKWSQLLGASIATIVAASVGIILVLGYLFVVIRKFPALTALLSCLLLSVTIMTAVIGIVLASSVSHIRTRSYMQMESLIVEYKNGASSKSLVTEIQRRMHCCGVEKATDWKYANLTEFHSVMGQHLMEFFGKRAVSAWGDGLDGFSTPDSCCRKETQGCGNGSLIEQNHIHIHGCAETIGAFLHKRYSTLIGMSFTVAVLTLLTAAAGIFYERTLRQQYEQM